ncbi:MAG TPA: hypothetical protein VGO60_09735 [Iamia sp.]|nr:hypothetical protein [Iamia sp.]
MPGAVRPAPRPPADALARPAPKAPTTEPDAPDVPPVDIAVAADEVPAEGEGATPDEGRSVPLTRRAAPTGSPRSSIAASAGMPERARVPAGRARVPAARARVPASRARVPSDERAPSHEPARAPSADPIPTAGRTATAVATVVEAPPEPVESMADRAIGRSLAQPPLPPHPGMGQTRRRLTVPPPSPPFAEADIPFHWRVQLPSAIGRTVTIQVGDGKLDLGGTVVAIDEVREVRFKLQVEAALFRRAASARMMVGLELKDGSDVRVTARNAASQRRAAAIIETLTYLWTLLSDTAGADERQILVEKIDRGAEVQVGRLRLTGIGIAWKQNPIARWGTIGDPRRVGLDVVIPTSEGEPIIVPLTADDAYQLPILVPLLRQRFA